MKVIIAGSRNINDYELLKRVIDMSDLNITEIISGKAKGVDTLGEKYGEEFNICVKSFPAKWRVDNKFDRSAGYKRNIEMSKYADAALIIWDGVSPGSKHMIKIMLTKKGKLFLVNVKNRTYQKFNY